jgi:phage gpG-like protein
MLFADGFLEFSVAGERQFKTNMLGILKRVKNFKPLAKPIDWVLRKNVEKHFRGEGTHKKKWAALAPSTQADRILHGYPAAHPILVRSGALKRSWLDRGHGKHILESTRKYIDFGTKVPYAIYHQTGTRKMKARKMVLADKGTLNQIVRFIRMYLIDNKVFKE